MIAASTTMVGVVDSTTHIIADIAFTVAAAAAGLVVVTDVALLRGIVSPGGGMTGVTRVAGNNVDGRPVGVSRGVGTLSAWCGTGGEWSVLLVTWWWRLGMGIHGLVRKVWKASVLDLMGHLWQRSHLPSL